MYAREGFEDLDARFDVTNVNADIVVEKSKNTIGSTRCQSAEVASVSAEYPCVNGLRGPVGRGIISPAPTTD